MFKLINFLRKKIKQNGDKLSKQLKYAKLTVDIVNFYRYYEKKHSFEDMKRLMYKSENFCIGFGTVYI